MLRPLGAIGNTDNISTVVSEKSNVSIISFAAYEYYHSAHSWVHHKGDTFLMELEKSQLCFVFLVF